MLDDAKLSDLFFNYEHPNYDALFTPKHLKAPPPWDVIGDAIALDAAEFANDFPEFGKDAAWFASDFMNRL